MPEELTRTPASSLLDAMYPAEDQTPPADDPPADDPPEGRQEPEGSDEAQDDGPDDDDAPAGPEEPTADDTDGTGDDDVGGDESDDDDELAAKDGDDDEAEGEDGEDAVEVSSFEELAEHLETDPEWLESLTIRKKINGKEVDVPIAAALETHSKVTSADEYLEDAKAKRVRILEEATAEKDIVGEVVTTFATLLGDLKEVYKNQYESVDWDSLRADDPGAYAARREDARTMQAKIAELEDRAKTTYREAKTNLDKHREQTMTSALPDQIATLHQKLPDWKDEKRASKEKRLVAQYMSDQGLSPEHIEAAAFNAVILSMAVKAMRYDKTSGAKESAKKKRLLNIPKVTRSGKKPKPPAKTKQAKDRASAMYG